MVSHGRPPRTARVPGRAPGRARWVPALERSRPARSSPIQPGARAPRPTSTRLPTMFRTMWWRKLSADSEMARLAPGSPSAPSAPCRWACDPRPAAAQKAEKSCLPRSARSPPASRRRRGEARMPGVRRRNGWATAAPVDQVEVPLAQGRAPRVESRGRFGYARARASRRQQGVQARGQRRGRSREADGERLATWPRACTPASVRLAPVTFTGSPSIRAQASSQALHCRAVRLNLPARKSVPS